MKRTMICLLAVGIAAGLATSALASREMPGEEKARQFCTQTADFALQACTADIAEEYYRSRAVCLNTLGRSCYREFNELREELRQECNDIHESRLAACDLLGEGRYLPDFDPDHFTPPDEITTQNPYWSLAAGRTEVLTGEDEIIIVHTTNRVRDVDGVPCRVVVDVAFDVESGDEKNGGVEYVIAEITDDWYAYHGATGDVHYCGEHSRSFEDGILADLEGSFEAGVEGAKSGILVPFEPEVGQAYRQEFALDEAEDIAQVVSLAATPPDKGGDALFCNDGCLQTLDFTPLEPGVKETKFYEFGRGFVLAYDIEDGEIEGVAEELACVGDSLDVLTDPSCGIEDVEALQDALCKVDPDTFCND